MKWANQLNINFSDDLSFIEHPDEKESIYDRAAKMIIIGQQIFFHLIFIYLEKTNPIHSLKELHKRFNKINYINLSQDGGITPRGD